MLKQRSRFSWKASSYLHVTVQTLFTAERPSKGPVRSGPDPAVEKSGKFPLFSFVGVKQRIKRNPSKAKASKNG